MCILSVPAVEALANADQAGILERDTSGGELLNQVRKERIPVAVPVLECNGGQPAQDVSGYAPHLLVLQRWSPQLWSPRTVCAKSCRCLE